MSRSDSGILKLFEVVCILGLAGTFFYAGGEKINHASGFAIDLQNYKLLPQWAVHGVALVFPWWEVLAAAVILIPTWRRAGAVAMFLMGLVFFISVSQALYRGLDISCGCFGHGEHASKAGLKTLAIDVAVMVGGLFVARRAALPAGAVAPIVGRTLVAAPSTAASH